MSDFKFYDYDTLDWGGSEDDDDKVGGPCSPTRAQILDAHRCEILESYMTKKGFVGEALIEMENGVLEVAGRGWNSRSTTRIGIDKEDVPKKYRSPFSRLFNKLDKVRIAAVLDTPCKGGVNRGHIYDLANEHALEQLDVEYHEYRDRYWIFTRQGKETDAWTLAINLEDCGYLLDDSLTHVENEAIDEFWEGEGRLELANQLASLHSGVEEEWDGMSEEEEEMVSPFIDAISKENDLSYILSVISETMCDATHEVHESGAHDYYVDSNINLAQSDLYKTLKLHPIVQLIWDRAIEQGDHDLLLKHITNMAKVQHFRVRGHNSEEVKQDGYMRDAIQLLLLETSKLSSDHDISQARERGQGAMFETEEVIGCV